MWSERLHVSRRHACTSADRPGGESAGVDELTSLSAAVVPLQASDRLWRTRVVEQVERRRLGCWGVRLQGPPTPRRIRDQQARLLNPA